MRSARRASNITLAEGLKLILRKIRKLKPAKRYLFVADPDLMVKKKLRQLATIDQGYWRPGRRLGFLDCPRREAARRDEKPGLVGTERAPKVLYDRPADRLLSFHLNAGLHIRNTAGNQPRSDVNSTVTALFGNLDIGIAEPPKQGANKVFERLRVHSCNVVPEIIRDIQLRALYCFVQIKEGVIYGLFSRDCNKSVFRIASSSETILGSWIAKLVPCAPVKGANSQSISLAVASGRVNGGTIL